MCERLPRKKKERQTFNDWYKSHSCDAHSLWLLQNCLGALLGFEHPDALEALEAWKRERERESAERTEALKTFFCDEP